MRLASYVLLLGSLALHTTACARGPGCRPFCRPYASACGDGLLDLDEACDDGNLLDGDGCSASCDQLHARDTFPASGAVDVLFVIDDSGTMCEEQAALQAGLGGFLDGLSADPAVDFHLGVITTDTNSPLEAGRLQNTPVSPPETCALAPAEADCTTGLPRPLPKVLARETPSLARVFSCIATVGLAGYGGEAPLAAIDLALRPALAADPNANAGFAREDALLAIVIVGDEDDCSVCGDDEWEGECAFLPSINQNLDCSIFEVEDLTPPSRFVRATRARHWTGRTMLAAIIGLDANGTSSFPVFPDPDIANHHDEVFPICESASGRAAPAPRLDEYARAFMPDATLESLCDLDLAARLAELGQWIGDAAVATNWCLSHAPSPDIAGADYTVVLHEGAFETELGPADYAVVADATCGSGARLELTTPLPPGATVTSRYPS